MNLRRDGIDAGFGFDAGWCLIQAGSIKAGDGTRGLANNYLDGFTRCRNDVAGTRSQT